MAYQVSLTAEATRNLDALPDKLYRQVRRHIDALATVPRPPGSKKLAGHDELWRVRSGDFRIVYQVKDKALLVLVVRVGNRREVYRGL